METQDRNHSRGVKDIMQIPITDAQRVKIFKAAGDPEVIAKLKEPGKGYIAFPMEKKSGGLRWIHKPHFLVKNAQKVLLENLPNPSVMQRGHEVVTGFVPGRSILDNARPHVGKTVVLSIDLRNFFPSFSKNQLYEAIKWVDRNALYSWSYYGGPIQNEIEVFNLITTKKGKLPQGAPTSPMIANWCCIEGDKVLADMCAEESIDYTRYADDLTFSTMRSEISEEFVQKIITAINDHGIFGRSVKVANNKIKFMRKHKQQRVTGIVVNEKLSIPRARRKRLRAFMHDCEKNGVEAALGRENRSIHHIFGEFSFLNLAHKETAEIYIQQFKELL